MDMERLGEQLSAYLDGELNQEEKALVERALREDAGARRLLDELRQMAANVESLPRHAAPGSILEDVRFQLERSELLGDSDEDEADRGGRGIGGAMRWAMAATLGFAAIGALWAIMGRDEPIRREQVALRQSSEFDGGSVESKDRFAKVEAEESPSTRPRVKVKKRSRRNAKGRDTEGQRHTSAVFGRRGLEQPAAVAGSPGDKRADDPGSPQRVDAIVDARDVDAKLAQGGRADTLRQHTFGNETVKLEIRARDEATRDRIERQLLATLASRRVVDLGAQDPNAKPTRFYYRGQADVNYNGSGRRQVLVRARVGEVEAMLGELGYGGPGTPDDVTLVVDKFRFQGRRAARETLRRLVPNDDPTNEEALAYSPVAVVPVTGGSPKLGAVENLARGFGVDPDMFKKGDVFMDLDVTDDRDPRDAVVGAQTTASIDERDDGASPKKKRRRRTGAAGAERKSEGAQGKEEAIQGEGGREPASLLEDRPTLVDRRIAALERQATRVKEVSKSALSGDGRADTYFQLDVSQTASVTDSPDKSTGPFITLVVDLILPEPSKTTAVRGARTKAKSTTNTKTPRKTSPKNPSTKNPKAKSQH